jgi:ATP diphosphatase
VKLQSRAGTVGFDWNDPKAVLDKMREELDEIEEALDQGDSAAIGDEIGDMLFAIANLARHLQIDPDAALSGTNAKFMRRFAFIEQSLAAKGRTLADSSLDEMEVLWNDAKTTEKR